MGSGTAIVHDGDPTTTNNTTTPPPPATTTPPPPPPTPPPPPLPPPLPFLHPQWLVLWGSEGPWAVLSDFCVDFLQSENKKRLPSALPSALPSSAVASSVSTHPCRSSSFCSHYVLVSVHSCPVCGSSSSFPILLMGALCPPCLFLCRWFSLPSQKRKGGCVVLSTGAMSSKTVTTCNKIGIGSAWSVVIHRSKHEKTRLFTRIKLDMACRPGVHNGKTHRSSSPSSAQSPPADHCASTGGNRTHRVSQALFPIASVLVSALSAKPTTSVRKQEPLHRQLQNHLFC